MIAHSLLLDLAYGTVWQQTARVGYYTQTISTNIQNASIWSLTAATPSDSVFHAPCTNSLNYLITYFFGSAGIPLFCSSVLVSFTICDTTSDIARSSTGGVYFLNLTHQFSGLSNPLKLFIKTAVVLGHLGAEKPPKRERDKDRS